MKQSNMIRTAVHVILACVVALSASGCVMQQKITMASGTNGSAATSLEVDQFFINVLEDFAALVPSESDQSIMDSAVEDFTDILGNKKSAFSVQSRKTGPLAYDIQFSFNNLETLLLDMNNGQSQSILTIRPAGTGMRMEFFLDLDNYPQLAQIVPFLADPNFETFGPLYNIGLSEVDYLDMIQYILGEEGPDAIRTSVISLRFTTPKPIIALDGGVKEDATTARFDIPLADILLLAEPIAFSVTW